MADLKRSTAGGPASAWGELSTALVDLCAGGLLPRIGPPFLDLMIACDPRAERTRSVLLRPPRTPWSATRGSAIPDPEPAAGCRVQPVRDRCWKSALRACVERGQQLIHGHCPHGDHVLCTPVLVAGELVGAIGAVWRSRPLSLLDPRQPASASSPSTTPHEAASGEPRRPLASLACATERLAFAAALAAESVRRLRARALEDPPTSHISSAYDENPFMLLTIDPTGKVLAANRTSLQKLGYTRRQLLGMRLDSLHVAPAKALIDERLAACRAAPGSTHRWETFRVCKDGGLLWVRETARVVEHERTGPAVLLVGEDLGETRRRQGSFSDPDDRDHLTGLLSRSTFERRLERVLHGAAAQGTEHALCYLDLDQFKVINETCGHSAGDELLRQIAGVLLGCVRQRDTLARLRGDEFAVLLERCPIPQAMRVADALREAVESFRFHWQDQRFAITASIGLVPITAAVNSVAAVLGAADGACRTAKESGRNRVRLARHDDAELSRRHGEMQWVPRITRALEEDRLRLCVQPIAAVAGGGARGGQHCELLLRMENEQGKLVLPEAFLPAAERFGLATRLDRWVVRKTLTWLVKYPRLLDDVTLWAINLSGHSLADEAFLAFVVQEFAASGIPPARLCFEVTETAAVSDLAAATHFINTLKGLGCRFALDDFGAGLSSFAYLRTLPVDLLKIDGMFVRGIADDAVDLAMVRSINEIGHIMGKQTVAEFVENDRVLARLQEIGVDYAQGYEIGRPRPIEAMTLS